MKATKAIPKQQLIAQNDRHPYKRNSSNAIGKYLSSVNAMVLMHNE